MIPAIWGAMKAATWAQRGIVAGVVVGAFAATFAWGYLKGHDSCENKQAQDILAQALDANKHEAQKAESLARVEERFDEKERQADKQTQVVTHEVIKVVEKVRPIELDPRYRELLDAVQRLQRDAENRVSQADPGAVETEELRTAKITTNQLLLAYTELANARRKDLELIEYVKAFEKARYEGEMAFYNGLPPTARANED